ncbi:MAG: YitT family protein, partial [Bacteroidia bacterium]|nr:YitT family protein [Bacteroidia bacterium]
DEVCRSIINKLGRGVTTFEGTGGFGKRGENHDKTNIIYSVITRLEISRLQSEIQKIDPNAFVVMHSVTDIKGGMIKKRHFKE